MARKVSFDLINTPGAEPRVRDQKTGIDYVVSRIPPDIAKKLARQIIDGRSYNNDHTIILACHILHGRDR